MMALVAAMLFSVPVGFLDSGSAVATLVLANEASSDLAFHTHLVAPQQRAKNGSSSEAEFLVTAAFDGRLKSVKYYISTGVSVDSVSRSGSTALYAAAVGDHADIVKWLLAKGASPHGHGASVPILAAAHCGPETLRALIEAGAKIESKDYNGWTPLFISAANGKAANVRVLLAAKASPNTADPKGHTPLHWAAARRHSEIVKLLIRAGANVSAADLDGMTPFLEAVKAADRSSAGALLEAGANPKAKANDGSTALDIIEAIIVKAERSAEYFGRQGDASYDLEQLRRARLMKQFLEVNAKAARTN
jgi:ankyrin repeat protein